MNERTFARFYVVATVGVVMGALFYFWAELNWKNLGSRAAVFGITFAGAALGALWAFRMARRPTPIDWIHELVRTAMLATLVSGVGALVAHLGDLALLGQAGLGNNQPNAWTPLFVTLLVASTLLATSSVLPVWRHRHAVRVYGDRPLAETLAACGAWLACVAFAFALLGFVVEADLAHPLAPIVALSLLLLLEFAVHTFSLRPSPSGEGARTPASLRSAGSARPRAFARSAIALAGIGAVLAVLTAVFGLTGFPLVDREVRRDEVACLAADHPGLLLDTRASRVTAYRARGVSLRRVECRTTFQYTDERHIAVVGRDTHGDDHQGAKLFVRVVGSPLERARAACEILLADRCEAPLAYPSELSGLAAIPAGGVLVPRESAGRLAFFAVTHEYSNGRGTTVGRRRVLVPHEIELATGRVLETR